MSLEHCRIVLVRTEVAGNLGATARVMRNMGLSDLVLVAPKADPACRKAQQLSTHGQEILDGARIVTDLGDALADCMLVAATSARLGGLYRKQSLGPPDAIMPKLVDMLPRGRVALVFGPEPTGLTNAEVTRCHYLIHIPTDPVYPALNLAQAVAICTYELRQHWLGRSEPAVAPPLPASFEAQEHMYGRFRSVLEEIHFLYGPKGDSLWHALRHLLGRSQLTAMEVDVLEGLARQIRWYVDQHTPK
jgi:tRNA/rRNA methyltransferase